MSKIEAVLFDAGHTLLRVTTSVGDVYARTAASYGVHAEAETIDQAFREAWARRHSLVKGTDEHVTSDEHERAWWRELVAAAFEPAGGIEGFDGRFDEFFDELYTVFAGPEAWHVYDDVLPALALLGGRGLRMAVVSNWDSRLPGLLETLGLRHHFEFVLTSAQAGYEKPDTRLFNAALNLLGLPADRVIHVGDSYEEDVLGARNAGLSPVLLDRTGKPDSVVARIASLEELPAWIEQP